MLMFCSNSKYPEELLTCGLDMKMKCCRALQSNDKEVNIEQVPDAHNDLEYFSELRAKQVCVDSRIGRQYFDADRRQN
ncbi:hypothetical protein KP509_05G070500 [Ceratopteris richardii]|uniref:Uncharacterized protein n=1 Tax=Ceratopteris richardii TaxID=49495 RepID=A0A8T2URN8_CERRI|nr:hypothetical protein KP509_05G070500 [Ceratopteris richardii]